MTEQAREWLELLRAHAAALRAAGVRSVRCGEFEATITDTPDLEPEPRGHAVPTVSIVEQELAAAEFKEFTP